MPGTGTSIPLNGQSSPPPIVYFIRSFNFLQPVQPFNSIPFRNKKTNKLETNRYENEHACGRAISDWLEDHPLVTREEVFYTTKLKTNVSRLDTVDKIKKSLKTSTLSYIDLYLLHSPIGGKAVREECWKGCMDAKEYGWVKSIGES